MRGGRGLVCRDLIEAGRFGLDLLVDVGFLTSTAKSPGATVSVDDVIALPAGRIGLDHHQRGTDRHLVADLTREFDDGAGDGQFHLDRRLVGHHVGELLVFLDAVADLDVPRDDLGLGNAFADIGELEREACRSGCVASH